jgi:hypothetical protein
MPKLRHLAALAAAVCALSATPALAAPVTVNVRVEGATHTIYEGPVTTDSHLVDGGDGTGQHVCDGTNAGAYPSPGPTQTGALDDAARTNGFTWLASWSASAQDFFISTIGGDSASSTRFWNLVRNWTSLQTGGCQQQVQNGDDLLFALTGFDPTTFATWPLLELRGAPATEPVNQPFTVHVLQHDGNGSPATDAAGANVAGQTTGADGTATVSFDSPGVQHLKADRSGSIRSNGETVCVYVPGSGDCGTDKAQPTDQPATTPGPAPVVVKDTTAPVVHVRSPQSGKTYRHAPRVLAGTIDETGGVAQVFLRLRATTNGGGLTSTSRCRWFSGKRGVFTHRTVPCSKARFFRVGSNLTFSYLLPAGLRDGRYVLDVKVLDRAYNAGRASVPFAVR